MQRTQSLPGSSQVEEGSDSDSGGQLTAAAELLQCNSSFNVVATCRGAENSCIGPASALTKLLVAVKVTAVGTLVPTRKFDKQRCLTPHQNVVRCHVSVQQSRRPNRPKPRSHLSASGQRHGRPHWRSRSRLLRKPVRQLPASAELQHQRRHRPAAAVAAAILLAADEADKVGVARQDSQDGRLAAERVSSEKM